MRRGAMALGMDIKEAKRRFIISLEAIKKMVQYHSQAHLLSVFLTLGIAQRYREEDILCRLHLDDFGFWENMVAGANSAAHSRFPVGDVPLQTLGCDAARLLERDDPHVLAKHLFLTILFDLDAMSASL